MITKINVKDFKCSCVRNETSATITYMIYPALEPFAEEWLEKVSNDYGVSVVAVYVPADKWNDALTPWPEPGEAKGFEPFAGNAPEFLKLLQNEIIPATEKTLHASPTAQRDIIGVSLGGLFTLWQWMQCSTFRSIASLSGSFWYDGFMEWFDKQPVPEKEGKAFFLLGEEEPKAHIVAYRSVGVNTEAIVERFKKAGIPTIFEWVPGNHFSKPLHRAEKAFQSLYK